MVVVVVVVVVVGCKTMFSHVHDAQCTALALCLTPALLFAFSVHEVKARGQAWAGIDTNERV